MMHLIDDEAQKEIAKKIDEAVARVLKNSVSHGNEEALTSALGQNLAEQSFSSGDLKVNFNYRQLNKCTEEKHAGADGGFLVKVKNLNETVEKVALFQAKKLCTRKSSIRSSSMSTAESKRLAEQCKKMLQYTEDSVAMFYTEDQIYIIDAEDFDLSNVNSPTMPLSNKHRLITLGTYLGKWLPRCTRGDTNKDLFERVKHLDGFKYGLSMTVISEKPSVNWPDDDNDDSKRSKSKR